MGLVVAYPTLFPSNYAVGAGILVGVMAVATVGLILLVGYARQLAVGQAAFCMIGAYVPAGRAFFRPAAPRGDRARAGARADAHAHG
jgi:ABC-type branched-subunit amino acid transport system permease subunit